MGINKEGFVKTLLDGHGVAASGAFPDGFSTFGGENVTAEAYDPEGAKAVLEEAGWVDSDGDGIREKDGVKLSVRWLTYPSRQELPLLAESAQASLKEIGIDVDINCTANRREFLADHGQRGYLRFRAGNSSLRRPPVFLHHLLRSRHELQFWRL